MLTQCPHCGTGFEIEEAHPPPGGLQVQCVHCNLQFAAVLAPPEPQPPPQLLVRQVSGTLFNPGDLATLQRWIVERRVIRDDLLARDGQAWQRLGNIPDLAPFFRATTQPIRPTTAAAAALGNAPMPQPSHPVMPRVEPNEDIGDIQMSAQRRATGRRRTASRVTMDDIFTERPGPSGFSFTGEFYDEDESGFTRRRSRHARRLFGVLLVCMASLLAVYITRPSLVSEVVSMLRRAPVSDMAVHEVAEGYKGLALDSVNAITAASGAFESASKIDGHYAEARAGVAEAQLALAETSYQTAQDLEASSVQNKRERNKRQVLVDDQRQTGSKAAERAFAAAKEALTLAPQSAAANRAMADYFRVQGADSAKILPLLERARAVAPNDARVMAVAAAVLADREPGKASDQYLQALAVDPSLNRIRYRLARLYLKMNDRTHALTQVEAILKAAPAHELAQELLLQLQPPAETPPAAAPSAAVAIAPAPAAAGPPPVAAAAPSAVTASRPPAAIAAVPAAAAIPSALVPPPAVAAPVAKPAPRAVNPGPALSATPTFSELLAAAQSLRTDHKTADAADLYRRAIAKDSSAPEGYVGLGWCQLDSQQASAAKETFVIALEKGPWSAEAHFGAAETYRAQGDRRAAVKHYRQVLVIQPDGAMANLARQMLEELSK